MHKGKPILYEDIEVLSKQSRFIVNESVNCSLFTATIKKRTKAKQNQLIVAFLLFMAAQCTSNILHGKCILLWTLTRCLFENVVNLFLVIAKSHMTSSCNYLLILI